MQLSDLVSPTPVDAFLREHCGQRFFHQPGAGERFDGLLSWAALNRILEDHRLEPPRLRLARDGAPVPDERYAVRRRTRRGVSYPVLDPARLREELAAGATLVLDGVDELHRPVRDLAASLERELGERTQVNLYASWRERRGFGMHWDDHDVLVLQVSGRKRRSTCSLRRTSSL